MNQLKQWKDVPAFANSRDEAAYWNATELDHKLMDNSLIVPDTRESTTITLRFDPRMLARIKRVARSRYLNYQSMMKQWLAERLDSEVRMPPDDKP